MRSIDQITDAMQQLAQRDAVDVAQHDNADSLLLEAVESLAAGTEAEAPVAKLLDAYRHAVGRSSPAASDVVAGAKTEPIPLDAPGA